MKKSHVTALALLVAGAVHATSRSASALSCLTNWVAGPGRGATNVPTNTLLWGHGSKNSSTRLVGPAGDVALEDRSFDASGVAGGLTTVSVLRPSAELEPDTRYTVVIDHGDAYPPEQFVFDTGTGPATTAPSMPELVSTLRGAGRGWSGLGRWVELEFAPYDGFLIGQVEGALGDVTSIDGLLDQDSNFDASQVAARTPVVHWITDLRRVFAGRGDCLAWPDDSNRQSARFGVMDVAGNFSGWSSDTVLELPDDAEAQQLADEAAAEAAAAAELAARIDRKSCALGVANSRALDGSTLVALMALAAARFRSQRRRPSQPKRSIDH